METRIGVVDVKSSLVHFHVERSIGNYESGGLIPVPFDKQLLNLGNGFNWVNQWFEAPYNGTYFFSISGTKNHEGDKTCFHVRLNNINIAQVLSSENSAWGGFATIISRKLNVGDKIELVMHEDGGNVYLLYFTGWLVDQDLVI